MSVATTVARPHAVPHLFRLTLPLQSGDPPVVPSCGSVASVGSDEGDENGRSIIGCRGRENVARLEVTRVGVTHEIRAMSAGEMMSSWEA